MAEFEPEIVAFCCNYCAYRAADLAGNSRMQYPPNLKIIRVPCSGRIDLTYVLRAFEGGADGVFIAACLEGGCHFVEGNIRAKARIRFLKELLGAIGFEVERLEMFNLSASMGPRFVEIAKEMTDRISKLGPSKVSRHSFTKRKPDMNKREFLYRMLGNLAIQRPEKPIPVPDELEEVGGIECNLTHCIGCKRCMEACPEKAIEFVNELDLPSILQNLAVKKENKITKRYLLYETLAHLAIEHPSRSVSIPEGMDEFSKFSYKPERCVLCDRCIKICPEKAIKNVKEIDLPVILDSLFKEQMKK